MIWTELDLGNCPVSRTLERLGDRWTMLVLREVTNGVHRFGAIQEHLGISRTVLSDRLAHLVDEGFLDAIPYREPGQRERREYVLTDRGRDVRHLMIALLEFGNRHYPEPEGPVMRLQRRDRPEEHVRLVLVDESGAEVERRDAQVVPGPGARVPTA